ncbi:MAG: hypothetical protein R6W31_20300 [Bacteroidales bacterium]
MVVSMYEFIKKTMDINFEVSAEIPASSGQIYDAWLDSEQHSAMTGIDRTALAYQRIQ